MKQIKFEESEINDIIDKLKSTNIDKSILVKFEKSLTTEKSYQKEDFYHEEGYFYFEYLKESPLEFYFELNKRKGIRDHTKARVCGICPQRYLGYVIKEHFFLNLKEGRVYGCKEQLKVLTKKMNSLKTEKGKKPYIEKILKITKKLKRLEQ